MFTTDVEFCNSSVLILNPNFVFFIEKKVQGYSCLWVCSRCSKQHWLHFSILHDVKMNRIAWMAHEATGNSVDTLVGCSKYPRGRSISSTYIGQHFVILHDSKTGDVCVFRQKCSESNRWYPFSYKYYEITKVDLFIF